jgi:hypothetical protein
MAGGSQFFGGTGAGKSGANDQNLTLHGAILPGPVPALKGLILLLHKFCATAPRKQAVGHR